jgi:hypothetical protein
MGEIMLKLLKKIFWKKNQFKTQPYKLTIHHCSSADEIENTTNCPVMGTLQMIKCVIFSNTHATSFTLIEDPAKHNICLIFDSVPSNIWDLFHQYMPCGIAYEFFDKEMYVDMKG